MEHSGDKRLDSYAVILERLRKEAIRKYGTQVDFGMALFPSKSKPTAGSSASRLLRGESGWRLADFAEACHLLGVSADYILGLMPQETYAKVTGVSGTTETVTIPYVECADLANDAHILQRGKAIAAARVFIDDAIRYFYDDNAPTEWEYGRMVVIDVAACDTFPGGAKVLVDRKAPLETFAKATVAIHHDGACALGRIYGVGDVLVFTPLGGGEILSLGEGTDLVGVVILLVSPPRGRQDAH